MSDDTSKNTNVDTTRVEDSSFQINNTFAPFEVLPSDLGLPTPEFGVELPTPELGVVNGVENLEELNSSTPKESNN